MFNLHFLVWLTTKVGPMIIEGFDGRLKKESEWKDDNTPVTSTDKAVNDFVLNAFAEQYPEVSVIAEEGSREVPGADWLVYCDPIDGTFPFATGVPISTFCISALYKGEPRFAVIYDPFMKRMFTVEKGKGAYLDGKSIFVSEKEKLDVQSHVHIIWWKNAYKDLAPVCNQLSKQGVPWMNFCSIAIVGGLIASGQFEASIFPGNKVWETAAMSLLVEEAGGKCTDLEGHPIDYLKNGEMKGHIISNGLVHDELVEMIRGYAL